MCEYIIDAATRPSKLRSFPAQMLAHGCTGVMDTILAVVNGLFLDYGGSSKDMKAVRLSVSECLTDGGWEEQVNETQNCVPAFLAGIPCELPVPEDPTALEHLFPYSLTMRGFRHSCDWLVYQMCTALDFLSSLLDQCKTAVALLAYRAEGEDARDIGSQGS